MLWSGCVVFYGYDNYPVMLEVTTRFGEGLGEKIRAGDYSFNLDQCYNIREVCGVEEYI